MALDLEIEMRTCFVVLLVFLMSISLVGCPDKPKLPPDGREVKIEGHRAGFKIRDRGETLLMPSDLPRRKGKDGVEVLPVKAVVHKDVLYILWEDDSVDEWPKPPGR